MFNIPKSVFNFLRNRCSTSSEKPIFYRTFGSIAPQAPTWAGTWPPCADLRPVRTLRSASQSCGLAGTGRLRSASTTAGGADRASPDCRQRGTHRAGGTTPPSPTGGNPRTHPGRAQGRESTRLQGRQEVLRCRKPRCGWPRPRWPTATPPGRIPDFPVTRSHPPASWPSAANSSICRTYRKTAGEESRRRSPVANRWMRP